MSKNNFHYTDFFNKPSKKGPLPVIIGIAVFILLLFCAYRTTDTKIKILLYISMFAFLTGIYLCRMFKNVRFMLKEMYKDRTED